MRGIRVKLAPKTGTAVSKKGSRPLHARYGMARVHGTCILFLALFLRLSLTLYSIKYLASLEELALYTFPCVYHPPKLAFFEENNFFRTTLPF